MAHYLSICKDGNNKEFLLISEQPLEATLPVIKAQIFFRAPSAKLEDEQVNAVSYAISKKEVEILLNKAQERESHGFRTKGLFSEGRVDKKALFTIFSYPSVKSLEDLLKTIDLERPDINKYKTLEFKPDKEHILENRHHVFWERFLNLEPRENINTDNWNHMEARQTRALNEFNLIRLYLLEEHNVPIE